MAKVKKKKHSSNSGNENPRRFLPQQEGCLLFFEASLIADQSQHDTLVAAATKVFDAIKLTELSIWNKIATKAKLKKAKDLYVIERSTPIFDFGSLMYLYSMEEEHMLLEYTANTGIQYCVNLKKENSNKNGIHCIITATDKLQKYRLRPISEEDMRKIEPIMLPGSMPTVKGSEQLMKLAHIPSLVEMKCGGEVLAAAYNKVNLTIVQALLYHDDFRVITPEGIEYPSRIDGSAILHRDTLCYGLLITANTIGISPALKTALTNNILPLLREAVYINGMEDAVAIAVKARYSFSIHHVTADDINVFNYYVQNYFYSEAGRRIAAEKTFGDALKTLSSGKTLSREDAKKISALENEIVQLRAQNALLQKTASAAKKRAENTACENRDNQISQAAFAARDAERDRADEAEKTAETLRRDIERCKREAKMQAELLAKLRADNEHLTNKLGRPTKMAGVAKWASECFKDKLIITEKAEKLLNNEPEGAISVEILCDALEYLAEEYRDFWLGKMTQDQMQEICSYKYSRVFRVTHIGSGTTTYHKEDYSASYCDPISGKRIRAELKLHLAYGINPENLIRIYFALDERSQQLVIGSLPRHLQCLQKC